MRITYLASRENARQVCVHFFIEDQVAIFIRIQLVPKEFGVGIMADKDKDTICIFDFFLSGLDIL